MRGQGITAKTRLLVLRRDGYRCIVCGTDKEKLHAAHYYAIGRGRVQRAYDVATKNDPSNLLTLCQICHGFFDRSRRYLVPAELQEEREALYQHIYHPQTSQPGYAWNGRPAEARARLDQINSISETALETRQGQIISRGNQFMRSSTTSPRHVENQ